MKKFTVTTVTCMTLVLTGCSSVIKDHGLDYQTAQANSKTLELPEGHEPVQDRLVIPNEARISDLEATGEFDAPRAPFLYRPIADVPLLLNGESARIDLPADTARSTALITAYLGTLATEDMTEVVKSNKGDSISSYPIQLDEQGFWSRTWSSITRLYPAKYQLNFALSDNGMNTGVVIDVVKLESDEENAVDFDADERPTTLVLDIWNYLTRKVSEESVLLSDQGKLDVSRSPLWVNQQGTYAYFLGRNFDPTTIEDFIVSQPAFHIVDEPEKGLAIVPSEEVARVGDVVELTFPVKAQDGVKQMKLFNVYRRNLDDVEWTKRSYPYDVVKQQEGYFLVVDTSALELPGLMSYRLLSMLVN